MPSAARTIGTSFMIDSLLGWSPVTQHETIHSMESLPESSQSAERMEATANSQSEGTQIAPQSNKLGTPDNSQSERRTGTPESSESDDKTGVPERKHSKDKMESLESSKSEDKHRLPEKPNQSYIALISRAILSSPEKRLQLSDIYQWIMETYPYYHNQDKSWRNSVRHNLSLNECFIKAGRSDNGKGHYWAVHPANMEDFSRGDYHRRRARRRVRRVSCVLGYPSHFPLCGLRCFHQRLCICCPPSYSASNLPRICPLVDHPAQRARQSLPIPLLWPWHQLPPYL
ncbi:uncharacterized protein O3C94_000029 [Discoglossus pictus]